MAKTNLKPKKDSLGTTVSTVISSFSLLVFSSITASG